jgi:hypothetical protein
MPNRTLASVAVIVWGIAVLLGVFVGAPLLLGLPINVGLIVGVLSPIATFAAVAASLWIALSERRELRRERDEHDRKQAGLIRVEGVWQFLGPGPHPTPSGDEDPHVQVIVSNFGSLPIFDLHVTKWDWKGHEAQFQERTSASGHAPWTFFKPPRPIQAVTPWGPVKGFWVIVPTDELTKTAMADGTITSDTDMTLTVEFTDAGEKRWKRSNSGALERIR